jgi:predicted anti-sigma-YlaC factor YlaD
MGRTISGTSDSAGSESVGNRAAGWDDNVDVDCSACRENLSAQLDGEQIPSSADAVERHLDECPDCRRWRDDASRLTSALRLRPAEPAPELAAPVLRAAPVRPRRRLPLRVALACVAACQLLLGIAQTTGLGHHAAAHAMTSGHAAMSGHLFNESTAWNLALGIGLLISAARPRVSSGLLPVLAAFLVVLTGFSASDLLQGAVPVARLASHGFLVLGLVLLLLVRDDRRPAPTARSDPESNPDDGTDPVTSTVDTAAEGGANPGLRPVNHRRAA